MPKGYRTCGKPDCGKETRSLLGSLVCVHCGTPFPAKVAKTIDESVLTLDDPYTRRCSDENCQALTRGNRCTDCRVCGKPLLRKEKKIREIEKAEPKARVYTAEDIEAAKTKKLCECGAYTPGYASKRCHACGVEFPKRAKEIVVKVEKVKEDPIDYNQPELQHKSEKWDLPKRYNYPSFLRNENLTFCEYPCPTMLKYKGSFPEDHEVIEWAHEVRQSLISFRFVYPNNGCLFYYLREQFKGKFAEQSDEMIYLRMLIEELPDRKAKLPAA